MGSAAWTDYRLKYGGGVEASASRSLEAVFELTAELVKGRGTLPAEGEIHRLGHGGLINRLAVAVALESFLDPSLTVSVPLRIVRGGKIGRQVEEPGERFRRGDEPGFVLDVGDYAGDVGVSPDSSRQSQEAGTQDARQVVVRIQKHQDQPWRARGPQLRDRQIQSPAQLSRLDQLVPLSANRLQDFEVLAAQKLGPDPLKQDADGAVLTVALDDGQDPQATQASSLPLEEDSCLARSP